MFQNFLPERVPFAMKNVFPSHPLGGKVKPANPAKQ
jgi:hypothetical protein